jgi:predicted RNA-binding Zn-ribbon protein involved in translation (DUF1610 family)
MEAFNPTPPDWTKNAKHALSFCCPSCQKTADLAQNVWINRFAPVISEDYCRKWQEFYHCECGQVWWGWSTDRTSTQEEE